MSLTDVNDTSRVHSVPPLGYTAITVFAEGKEGHNPQETQSEARRPDEQLLAVLRPEKIKTQSESWLLKSAENITIAPQCRQIMTGRLESENGRCPPFGLYRTYSDNDRSIFHT
jgi:hypothetical protein